MNNEGLITARLGRVDLAAGSGAVLTFDEDNMIGVRVSKDVLRNIGAGAAVSNSGDIIADGGMVVLSAAAARALFDTAVNNVGLIQANAAKEHSGRIFLTGAEGAGNVLVSGNGALVADNANGRGGSIVVTGDNVGLFDNAVLSANGAAGGGSVLLGGDYQGANVDVRNATAVYLGENTRVSADAILNGNGGKLIVWSDEATRVYGALSARGGSEGGDGGFIETSSHNFLDIGPTPDVTAANGRGGTWLIDPRNLTVTASTTANLAGAGTSASPFQSDGSGNASIAVSSINTALTGGATVVLRTISGSGGSEGDVIWQSGAVLDYNSKGDNALQIDAFDDILFSGTIRDGTSGGDSLAVSFNAQDDILIGGVIESNGGNISFTAGNNSGAGVGTGNTSGIVFEDEGTAANGVYGRIDAGSGNVQLTAGTGVVSINIDSANENYGSGALPAVIRGTNVTVITPQLIASNADFANKEIAAAGDVALQVAAVHGLAPTDSFDIVAAGSGGTMGTLKVEDTGVGDIVLRLLYDDLFGTTVRQDQVAIGNIDIGYNRNITFPSGDGNLVMLDDATNHVIDWLQTADQNIEIQVGAADLVSTTNNKQVSSGNLILRNTFADGDVLLNSGTFVLDGITPGMLQIETAGTGGNVDLANTSGDLSFSDLTDIGGNLNLISVGIVQLNNMVAGGDVDLKLTSSGMAVSSGSGFTYGGVLNALTRGNVTLEVSSVGTIDTTDGGQAGGHVVLTNGDGDIEVNYITTRDGDVTLDAADNVTVYGNIDALDAGGSTAGGAVLVKAGINLSLPSVIAGAGAVTVQAGLANAGSVNPIGSLQTTGVINVSGGSTGADEFLFGDPNAAGSKVNITGTGIDRVSLDGSGATPHTFSLSGNDISVDGSVADFTLSGSLQLVLTGSSGADTLSLNSSLASYYSAVTFNAGGGTDRIVGATGTGLNWDLADSGSTVSAENLTFSSVEVVQAGAFDDSITLNDYTGDLYAGDGADTINILGTLTGNLDAGAGADTVYLNGGTVTGTLDGGADTDSDRLNGWAGDDVFVLSDVDTTGGTLNGVSFTNFQQLDGGLESAGGGDSLIGTTGDNTFSITSKGSGTVGAFAFSNIESFDGGPGADVVDYSAYVDVSLIGATIDLALISNIETIVGSTYATDVLLGTGGADVATITATHGGDLNGILFSAIESIDLAGGDDSLSLQANGVMVNIDGGTGTDALSNASADPFKIDITADGQGAIYDGPSLSAAVSNFSGMENIAGGSGDDVFVVGATHTGILNGADGKDSFDLSAGFAVAQIEGGPGIDSVIGSALATTWTLNGSDGGTINNGGVSNFTALEEFYGGTGVDTFAVDGSAFTGLLSGGAGDDVFNINVDSGATFYGDAGSDRFVLADAINVSGTISGDAGTGGATGIDLIDMTGWTSDITLNMASNTLTGVSGTLSFLEGLEMPAGGNDTLIGGNGTNAWSIVGSNAITQGGGTFTGVDNLVGGTGADTFNFSASVTFAGVIDGGAGYNEVVGTTNDETLLLESGGLARAGTFAGTAFSNIDGVNGNGGSDAAVGTAGDESVVLGASGAASFGTLNLIGFTAFDGAAGADTFSINGAFGSVVTLAGNAGDDRLEFNGGSVLAGSTFDGGANTALGDRVFGSSGADSFSLTGTSGQVDIGAILLASNIEHLDGNAGSDTLNGSTAGDLWDLADAGSTVAAMGFAGFEAIIAGNGANTFNIGTYTGNVTGGAGDDVFVLNGALSGSIDGNAGSDTLRGSTAADSVVLNGLATAGSINGAAFSNIETLAGNGGSDSITSTSATTFAISGTDSGTVGTLTFAGFGTLIGGAGNDTFNIGTAGRLTGGAQGNGGSDAVNGTSGTESWILANASDGNVTNGNGTTMFTGIESIDGGSGGSDTLTLTGALDETITLNGGGSGSVGTLLFAGITDIDAGLGNDIFLIAAGAHAGNLAGGAGDDDFRFNGGTLAGSIDAGSGSETLGDRIGGTTGNDTAVVSGANAGTFNGISFMGIERIDAGAGSDTISTSGTNTWSLGGGIDQVSGITYTNFESLSAGNGIDVFNINGVVAYALNGNGGDDVFNFNVGGALNNNASGGDGDDTFNLLGGSVSGTLDGGSTAEVAGDTVAGGALADIFNVSGLGSGTANGIAFTGAERLQGNGGDDTFTMAAPGNVTLVDGGTGTGDVLSINSATQINVNGSTLSATQSTAWSGFENLQVTTSALADVVIDGSLALTGNLSISSAGAISTLGGAASRVGANAVNATAVGNVGLYTDTLGLDVASSNGNVTIDELSGLGAVRVTGVNVGLVVGGAVSDADASVDLAGSASTTINVATGDIGTLTAPLQIQSPVVSTITGNGAQFITLASNVGRLNISAGTNTVALRTATAAQTIGQDVSDQILAGSLLLLNGSYALDGNNAVGTLAANTDGAVIFNNGANNLAIGSIDIISGITTTDDTVGLAAGTISQDGTAAIVAGALVVGTTGGNVTLTAAGNDFATVAANVQGNLVLVEANGFDVGTVGGIDGITSTGFTAITSGGAVTDSSALRVGGLALAGTGSYALDATGNRFGTLAMNTLTDTWLAQTGALSIGAVNGVAGVNTGAATFNLAAGTGGLSIAQNVDAGAIVLSADGNIGGAGILSAATFDLVAAGDVSVNTAIDTLRALSSGGSLTVNDAGALLIDSASAATALSISSSGDLSVKEVTANTVMLAATGGAIVDGNAEATNVIATTVALQAAGDIGTITDFASTAGDAIEVTGLAAGGLAAQTATGAINIGFVGDYVTGTDDVQGAATFLLGATGNLDAASGLDAFATATNIGLATAGTLTLPTMSTTGAGSTLQLSAADIVADGGVRTIGINVDTLRFNVAAPGGVTRLQGAIGTLASSSIGGDIFIDVNAPLTVNGLTTADGLVDILVSNGDATLLDINTSAVDDDSNDITVTASAGNIVVGVLSAGTQNDVTLTAAGSITDVANTVHAGVLTMNAGGDIGAADNHFNTDVVSIDGVSTGGSIWVDETDDIDVTNLSAPNGGVFLYTPGRSNIRSVTAGSSGITVLFNGGSLAELSTTGDIDVTAATDVSLDNASAGGGVAVTAGGNASIDNIVTGAGGFTADITGAVALGDIVANGGAITLTSGGDTVIGGLLETTGGAGNDIILESGGGILMAVDADGASAGIAQVDGASISLTALNDIYITLIDAGTGTVDITSTTGRVGVNARKLQSSTSPNIVADTTSISGAAGIGDLTGKQLVIDTNILNLSSAGVVIQPILLRDTIIVSDARITPPLSQILGNLKFDPDLEGLAYLDPAIFTAVGNYATDDNALELPEDQKVADGSVPDASQPVAQEQKQKEKPGIFKRIFGMLRALPGSQVPATEQRSAVPLAMN
ncbi:MAG: beta strand repeat-containing protein [Pseudomonadota bacterium]